MPCACDLLATSAVRTRRDARRPEYLGHRTNAYIDSANFVHTPRVRHRLPFAPPPASLSSDFATSPPARTGFTTIFPRDDATLDRYGGLQPTRLGNTPLCSQRMASASIACGAVQQGDILENPNEARIIIPLLNLHCKETKESVALWTALPLLDSSLHLRWSGRYSTSKSDSRVALRPLHSGEGPVVHVDLRSADDRQDAGEGSLLEPICAGTEGIAAQIRIRGVALRPPRSQQSPRCQCGTLRGAHDRPHAGALEDIVEWRRLWRFRRVGEYEPYMRCYTLLLAAMRRCPYVEHGDVSAQEATALCLLFSLPFLSQLSPPARLDKRSLLVFSIVFLPSLAAATHLLHHPTRPSTPARGASSSFRRRSRIPIDSSNA
ncbi:hypothetical protein C8R45DRAFT_1114042 [Mycena sanguinolenta]|nr:hypothetical protein C8R45DRAFT_1114042 [Mycena sanguinolenta]